MATEMTTSKTEEKIVNAWKRILSHCANDIPSVVKYCVRNVTKRSTRSSSSFGQSRDVAQVVRVPVYKEMSAVLYRESVYRALSDHAVEAIAMSLEKKDGYSALRVTCAVDTAHRVYLSLRDATKGLLSNASLQNIFQDILYDSRIQPLVEDAFTTYFSRTLRIYRRNTANAQPEIALRDAYVGDTSEDTNEDEEEGGSDEEEDEEENDDDDDDDDDEHFDMKGFENVANKLRELAWMSHLKTSINEAIHAEIEAHVSAKCRGVFDRRLLFRLRRWLESGILRWIGILFPPSSSSDEEMDQKTTITAAPDVSNDGLDMSTWRARLTFQMHDTFARLRVDELFSVMRDFPDSEPALHDLRRCLRRTHVQPLLVRTLSDAFRQRLLHPGVSTEMIITVYVSTIKALRLLDPKGVLLEAVSEPIRVYLRSRLDTVRCIVRALTNASGEGGELFEELSAVRTEIASYICSGSDDDADVIHRPGEFWMPEAVAVDPRKTSRSRRSADIISTLVHIFGSRDVFVNEYQLMLATKLLAKTDFDTDAEVHTLELLKLRFGESSLHACEIMLKDMGDSRRVNANIVPKLKDEEATATNGDTGSAAATKSSSENDGVTVEDVGVTLISRHFWPPLTGSDSLKLHKKIKHKLDKFAEEYCVLKNPRVLEWRRGLGFVEIELEFEDGKSREFRVSPEHATVISHFGDVDSWEVTALAEMTGLTRQTLTRRLNFWIGKGIVEADGDGRYRAVRSLRDEAENDADDTGACVGEGGEEAAPGVASVESQAREQMMVYESYVTGMLSNFGSLEVDRIHNMLKMFVNSEEHKYDKTREQLGGFLDYLVHEGRLECSGGMYSMAKGGG